MRGQSAINYIDGHRLSRALQAGVARLSRRQNHLNKINVFPVADGDTGTNLGLTLHAMLLGLRQRPERHAGRALTTLADAGLDGARGNSGAIMAQFFQGFSDACAQQAVLEANHFAVGASQGAEYAREAMTEPRDGTLLTVLHEFAESLQAQIRQTNADIRQMLEHSLEAAEQALARTPQQLAVLRRAGVVDAGAEGFVELLRGISEFLHAGHIRQLPEPAFDEAVEAQARAGVSDDPSEFRYCTECVIRGEDLDPRKIREALAGEGNSLVIAGARHKIKVHIHSNDPRRLFRLAGEFGEVSGHKADDMWQQQKDAAGGARRVAIVTDSAADLPEALLDELDIHVVPVHVRFGEKTYLDKLSLSAEDFYQRLNEDGEHPATSQPAPGEFRRVFQVLASHFDSVVAIHVTSRGSGTWQSAVSGARRVEGADIRVFDSRTLSAGLGLLVREAAEMAQSGASADEIMARLEDSRRRTRVWGGVRDLSFGVRGGRVSPLKQKLVDRLGLTPILTAWGSGKVDAGGILFGQDRVVERLARFVRRRARSSRRYRLLVGHCNCREDGQALLAQLRDALPLDEEPTLVSVGPALGAHAGPGTLVVALQEQDNASP
ncbi:DegV family protein [Gammaproteobacteria bacterium AB-CW1]|uniref:DegV family protein n=2 Tax=Natronospira TaxID=2024969 RepID=A0AAP6MKI9_9GAMM|nr:DegV family protein [Gammaproteobacteria bacterium AB-CW1]